MHGTETNSYEWLYIVINSSCTENLAVCWYSTATTLQKEDSA